MSFHSARVKLAGWYLLIIMLISIFFSGLIYRVATLELERGFRRFERRLQLEEFGFERQRPDWPIFQEDLETAKRRVVFSLLMINSAILIISTTAGYFLAGKTLKPIEENLKEQKRFVADASHEFRTPLTALKTSMEVALRDKKLTSVETRKLIKSNLEDIDGLRVLSNNLLSLANLQDNGKNLGFEKVEMKTIVDNACRKILALAKEKGMVFKTEVSKQTIFASREALEQMLVIFLDNSVKYSKKGGEISINSTTNKNFLSLEITDQGIGIAKKDLVHIFERFYRAEQSRSKEKVPGFGLGLSLAKRIIEIHKGTVETKSIVGKGTTFTIKLPLGHS